MFTRNRSRNLGQVIAVATGVIAFCAMFSGTASAQLSENKTRITFTVPVEIPDAGAQVLPPGTYTFKLVDSKTDRNIVQILSKDELHVYATILAIPNYRLKATDKTVMTFAERAAGQPQAIRAWFYPGERWGQEFVYPKSKAVELAKSSQQPVAYIPDEVAQTIVPGAVSPPDVATAPSVIALREVPVLVFKPTGEVVQVAEVFEAPPAQASQASTALPKTAGYTPLVALFGFLSLVLSLIISLPKSCAR